MTFKTLAEMTLYAWVLSHSPKEKEGLIKKVFISNAGFLDRCKRIILCNNIKDLEKL